MPRGRPGRKRATARGAGDLARPAFPPGTDLRLVPVDAGPIRAGAWAAYDRAGRTLARLKADLERYEAEDMPAFKAWEAAHLGAHLTRLRETDAELARILDNLARAEQIQFLKRCSLAEAYHIATRRPPEPDEHPGPTGDDPTESDAEDTPDGISMKEFERMSRAEQRELQQAYQAFRLMARITGGRYADISFEEFLRGDFEDSVPGGESADPFRSSGDGGMPRGRAAHPRQAPADPRLKRAYRAIVRLLHPDHNGAMGAWERDLWDQSQAAYAARDMDRLEAIRGLVEQGSPHSPKARMAATVSIVLRMCREIERATRMVRARLRDAKKHPAWQFSSPKTNRPRLQLDLQDYLEHEWRELARRLAQHRAIVARLQADWAKECQRPAGRGRNRRARRRPVESADWAYMETDFF